jgi:hypothetical protein
MRQESLPLYLIRQLRYSYRPHSDNAISSGEKQIGVVKALSEKGARNKWARH